MGLGSQGAPCWNHLDGELELELALVGKFQGALHQGHYGRVTKTGADRLGHSIYRLAWWDGWN